MSLKERGRDAAGAAGELVGDGCKTIREEEGDGAGSALEAEGLAGGRSEVRVGAGYLLGSLSWACATLGALPVIAAGTTRTAAAVKARAMNWRRVGCVEEARSSWSDMFWEAPRAARWVGSRAEGLM